MTSFTKKLACQIGFLAALCLRMKFLMLSLKPTVINNMLTLTVSEPIVVIGVKEYGGKTSSGLILTACADLNDRQSITPTNHSQ